MWPFFAYEKIAESLEAWVGDDEAAYRALRGVAWIATEKIHGASFCLVSDGALLRAGKRKVFLAPEEDFFGHRALVDRIGARVIALSAAVRAADAQVRLVYLHGELLGGGYPHPEVAADPAVQPVQTGCWYAPSIELCAFDLAVLREGDHDRTYVGHDEAARLFEEAGLLHARPLIRGTYEEVMRLPLGFESTLPALLGLPPLPRGNKAEGVVVKPVRAVTVPRRAGSIRPVIKRKIAEFAEDARFHEAEKWATRASPGEAAAALSALRWEVSARVVEPRLDAAVSKIGRIAPGDAGRAREVWALLVEDVLEDLALHERARMAALTALDRAALRRFVEGECGALVELCLGIALS